MLPTSRTRAHRRRQLLLGAFAAVVLVTSVAASPTHAEAPQQEEPAGGIGLRLLDAPVSAGDDPRARNYIVDPLAPGTEI